MQFIRERVLAGEVMLGIGANIGSSLTVGMIGREAVELAEEIAAVKGVLS